MNAEDAEIARTVRRELGKRPVNSTMVDVQVKSGKNHAHRSASRTCGSDKTANLRTEIDCRDEEHDARPPGQRLLRPVAVRH